MNTSNNAPAVNGSGDPPPVLNGKVYLAATMTVVPLGDKPTDPATAAAAVAEVDAFARSLALSAADHALVCATATAVGSALDFLLAKNGGPGIYDDMARFTRLTAAAAAVATKTADVRARVAEAVCACRNCADRRARSRGIVFRTRIRLGRWLHAVARRLER